MTGRTTPRPAETGTTGESSWRTTGGGTTRGAGDAFATGFRPARAADRTVAADYDCLGWPVTGYADRPVVPAQPEPAPGGRAQPGAMLVTGLVVDAIEVPYPAGVLAARWWLVSRGHQDPVRELPALPDPDRALAATPLRTGLLGTELGMRYLFVAAAGSWPWPPGEPAPGPATRLDVPIIRWHGPAGQVPVPPTPAAWAYPPTTAFTPLDPIALLELLSRAVKAVRSGPHLLHYDGAIVTPAP